jgi:hypothetical protein
MADMHMMLGPDGKLTEVDMGPVLARHRDRHIKARADAIDQAADLLMDAAFDPSDTWDACEASGMPEGAIDSAGNVALELSRVERRARG